MERNKDRFGKRLVDEKTHSCDTQTGALISKTSSRLRAQGKHKRMIYSTFGNEGQVELIDMKPTVT